MPISPERMRLYPGGSIRSKEWLAIRDRILSRANNKCEFCAAPDREVVFRFSDEDEHFYMLPDGSAYNTDGEYVGRIRSSDIPRGQFGRFVKIILTIMHLDHDPTNSADDNLKAGCQRCHNVYDGAFRRKNAEQTRRASGGQSDLFQAEQGEPND